MEGESTKERTEARTENGFKRTSAKCIPVNTGITASAITAGQTAAISTQMQDTGGDDAALVDNVDADAIQGELEGAASEALETQFEGAGEVDTATNLKGEALNQILGLCKIAAGNMQILMSFTQNLEVQWPSELSDFAALFTFLNFDFVSITTPCVHISFYNRLCTTLVAPPLAFGLLCLFAKLNEILGRWTRADVKKVTTGTALLALFIIYPGVTATVCSVETTLAQIYLRCAKVLQTWQCTNVNGIWYLKADYTIQCFNNTWVAWATVAVGGFFVYPIGRACCMKIQWHLICGKATNCSVKH